MGVVGSGPHIALLGQLQELELIHPGLHGRLLAASLLLLLLGLLLALLAPGCVLLPS